jgi:transcriptional regulator with XRE-family HTH domain
MLPSTIFCVELREEELMDNIATYVGKKINELRSERGISQEKLAKDIDVVPNTISRWENASNKPKLTELDRLANYFDVHISYFFPPSPITASEVLTRSAKGLDKDDLQEVQRFISFIKAGKQLKKK